jgi:predicted nucleic acid-binding protein
MSKTNYGWDTSVVIAWLCEEASAPLDDMQLVVEEIDSGSANLIFSVVTFSEILRSKYTEKQLKQLDGLLLRSNVVKVETSFAIALKAAQIREAGLREKKKRKIKTPDATVLATAILYKADVLHSLDPHMLNLNGSAIVDGLSIVKPRPITGPTIFTPQDS